jgi:lipopolysaccharide biosynthesis regulator YciM
VGLKAVNLLSPKVSAFDIARLITAVRPAEGLAQEYMMQTYEYYLMDDSSAKDKMVIDKRGLLMEAVERFDTVRKLEANNPKIGIREVKILMAHHPTYGTNDAHEKIRQILNANLKADPYHANSMIALSRLQLDQGHKEDALYTLQVAIQHVLTLRDEQLIKVETLRQYARPKIFTELDEIEEQLQQIRSDSETGKASRIVDGFYEHIDKRLNEIASRIKSRD